MFIYRFLWGLRDFAELEHATFLLGFSCVVFCVLLGGFPVMFDASRRLFWVRARLIAGMKGILMLI